MYLCSVYKEFPRHNFLKITSFGDLEHFYITTVLQNLGASLYHIAENFDGGKFGRF